MFDASTRPFVESTADPTVRDHAGHLTAMLDSVPLTRATYPLSVWNSLRHVARTLSAITSETLSGMAGTPRFHNSRNVPSAVRQISQYLSFTSAIAVTDHNLEQDRGHVSIWRKALYDGFMASRHAAAT
jgi:hypothetical protein